MSGRHGNIKLFLHLTASVKFLVLASLYEIIRRDIEESQSESEYIRINAYPPDRDGKPVIIRIIGQDLPAVSKAKTDFERLIKGDIILNDNGSPCWDDYSASPAGLEYVKTLSQAGRTFIYRDAQMCQLMMHGSTQAFEGTRQAILVKLKELSEMMHVLQLTPFLRSRAFNGAFRVIVEALGRSVVKLDVTTSPPSIVVKGNMSVFARAHSLLHSPLEGQLSPKNIPSTDTESPVCMMEPDGTVSLKCDHSYCKDCFEEQCKAADSSTIPLRCFGEYAKCSRTISLQDLKGNLPSEAFDALLSALFNTYLQKYPETYQYCPNPDCPTIYVIYTDGTTKSCPTCMTTICTSCQTVTMTESIAKRADTWSRMTTRYSMSGKRATTSEIILAVRLQSRREMAAITWNAVVAMRISAGFAWTCSSYRSNAIPTCTKSTRAFIEWGSEPLRGFADARAKILEPIYV
jgi:hypothetical protein